MGLTKIKPKFLQEDIIAELANKIIGQLRFIDIIYYLFLFSILLSSGPLSYLKTKAEFQNRLKIYVLIISFNITSNYYTSMWGKLKGTVSTWESFTWDEKVISCITMMVILLLSSCMWTIIIFIEMQRWSKAMRVRVIKFFSHIAYIFQIGRSLFLLWGRYRYL